MYIDESTKKFTLTKYAKVLILFTGLVIGFILSRIFLFLPFTVQDNSMNPGLNKGDTIIIFKIGSAKEGDITLFESPVHPDTVILKRIITSGEKTVEIKNKRIFVNNAEFSPRWPQITKDSRVFPEKFSNRDNLPQIKMKKGEFFLMGDNRDYSFDSRDFGPVSEKLAIGRMIYKF